MFVTCTVLEPVAVAVASQLCVALTEWIACSAEVGIFFCDGQVYGVFRRKYIEVTSPHFIFC